jgi:hypothetical protein
MSIRNRGDGLAEQNPTPNEPPIIAPARIVNRTAGRVAEALVGMVRRPRGHRLIRLFSPHLERDSGAGRVCQIGNFIDLAMRAEPIPS